MSEETDRWYYFRMREGVAIATSPDDVVVLSNRSWDQSEADGVSEWMPEPGDGKGQWMMCEFFDADQLRGFVALDRTDLSPQERLHRECIVAAILRAAAPS